ncbi:MAG: hypothetical protein C0478_13715 [Planctomyces sp.]|nr:hypothetical protein [Planctomyces sp.]
MDWFVAMGCVTFAGQAGGIGSSKITKDSLILPTAAHGDGVLDFRWSEASAGSENEAQQEWMDQ